MFGSDRTHSDETPSSPPITSPAQEDENVRRARILERKLSTPSTFKDRKAEAASAPGQQLVSMGTTEMVVQLGIHGGRSEVRSGELFFDRARPSKRYIKLEGDSVVQPLFDDAERVEEKPVSLPPMRSRPRLSGADQPSQPDPPPRPA